MSFALGWYGIALASYLGIKVLLSLIPATPTRLAWQHRRHKPRNVVAIVTVYNEDPAALGECLSSLMEQDTPPAAVVVVDDGSSDRRAVEVARMAADGFATLGVDYRLVELDRNAGKRNAIATAVHLFPDADAYVGVDSDTILATSAVGQIIAPLANRRIHAATGLVLASNRSTNLLTRLIDMRYVGAFLGDRAAYSRLGSMLCACGSLAAYRGWVVRKYLDDFTTQTWMGRKAEAGDDRRLTYYALLEGKAVIEPRAVAHTVVPERASHYLRQQARWTRSFLRESLLTLRTMRVGRAFWWLTLVEVATWSAFTGALAVALVLPWFTGGGWWLLVGYVAYASAASFLRSVHYLRYMRDADHVLTYLAAPLWTVFNIAALIPLRVWCLATIAGAGTSNWGTRDHVEVSVVPSLEGATA